jgi:tetratricopeptide (TPR) repeat protein
VTAGRIAAPQLARVFTAKICYYKYMQNRIMQTTALALACVLPIFFWMITPNYFNFSKQFLVLLAGLIILVTFFSKIIVSKSISFARSPLVTALSIFLVAIIASLAFNPEGRPEALAGKGTLLILLPLISIILIMTKAGKLSAKNILHAIMGVGVILSIHSLLQLTVLSGLSFLPSFMQTKLFTLTGDYLTTLTLILMSVAAAIASLKKGTEKMKPGYLIVTVLGTISAVAIISLMVNGGILKPTLIPYSQSWAIMLDSFKSFHTLFIGLGLSNYALLFSAVKPLVINTTELWNIVPQAGTSELLTLFSTTGLFGGLSMVWLLIHGLKSTRRTTLYLPTLVATLAIIFLPNSISTYALYFLLLAWADNSESVERELSQKAALGIGIAGIILTIAGIAYVGRPVIAEYYMGKAQSALKENNGKGVYDNHLQALKLYPRMTIYHMSYADVNLSLASALSQQGSLSEEDKNTVSQLVQQSIAEGKNSITLRPNYSGTWLTLGKIYRNLINVAQGAETFAIDNYAKAVSLDSANPALRLDYGGLFYQLGISAKDKTAQTTYFARAKAEFQTAIQLKPDYTNAYYNLAKLLESEGDYANAYVLMQKAISLLGPDNPDLSRATAEMEAIKAKVPATSPSPSPTASVITSPEPSAEPSDLSTPSPLPSPIPGTDIELQ